MNSLKIFLVLLFCLFAFKCSTDPFKSGGPFLIDATVTSYTLHRTGFTPEEKYTGDKTYYSLVDCFWVTPKKLSWITLHIDNPVGLPKNGTKVRVEGNVYVDQSGNLPAYLIHIIKFKILDQ